MPARIGDLVTAENFVAGAQATRSCDFCWDDSEDENEPVTLESLENPETPNNCWVLCKNKSSKTVKFRCGSQSGAYDLVFGNVPQKPRQVQPAPNNLVGELVTVDNFVPFSQVSIGRDWKWGAEQFERSSNRTGMLLRLDTETEAWCFARFGDAGSRDNCYRAGAHGASDLVYGTEPSAFLEPRDPPAELLGKPVTRENFVVGARVTRGKSWKYSNQDCGKSGILLRIYGSSCWVRWTDLNENRYRLPSTDDNKSSHNKNNNNETNHKEEEENDSEENEQDLVYGDISNSAVPIESNLFTGKKLQLLDRWRAADVYPGTGMIIGAINRNCTSYTEQVFPVGLVLPAENNDNTYFGDGEMKNSNNNNNEMAMKMNNNNNNQTNAAATSSSSSSCNLFPTSQHLKEYEHFSSSPSSFLCTLEVNTLTDGIASLGLLRNEHLEFTARCMVGEVELDSVGIGIERGHCFLLHGDKKKFSEKVTTQGTTFLAMKVHSFVDDDDSNNSQQQEKNSSAAASSSSKNNKNKNVVVEFFVDGQKKYEVGLIDNNNNSDNNNNNDNKNLIRPGMFRVGCSLTKTGMKGFFKLIASNNNHNNNSSSKNENNNQLLLDLLEQNKENFLAAVTGGNPRQELLTQLLLLSSSSNSSSSLTNFKLPRREIPFSSIATTFSEFHFFDYNSRNIVVKPDSNQKEFLCVNSRRCSLFSEEVFDLNETRFELTMYVLSGAMNGEVCFGFVPDPSEISEEEEQENENENGNSCLLSKDAEFLKNASKFLCGEQELKGSVSVVIRPEVVAILHNDNIKDAQRWMTTAETSITIRVNRGDISVDVDGRTFSSNYFESLKLAENSKEEEEHEEEEQQKQDSSEENNNNNNSENNKKKNKNKKKKKSYRLAFSLSSEGQTVVFDAALRRSNNLDAPSIPYEFLKPASPFTFHDFVRSIDVVGNLRELLGKAPNRAVCFSRQVFEPYSCEFTETLTVHAGLFGGDAAVAIIPDVLGTNIIGRLAGEKELENSVALLLRSDGTVAILHNDRISDIQPQKCQTVLDGEDTKISITIRRGKLQFTLNGEAVESPMLRQWLANAATFTYVEEEDDENNNYDSSSTTTTTKKKLPWKFFGETFQNSNFGQTWTEKYNEMNSISNTNNNKNNNNHCIFPPVKKYPPLRYRLGVSLCATGQRVTFIGGNLEHHQWSQESGTFSFVDYLKSIDVSMNGMHLECVRSTPGTIFSREVFESSAMFTAKLKIHGGVRGNDVCLGLIDSDPPVAVKDYRCGEKELPNSIALILRPGRAAILHKDSLREAERMQTEPDSSSSSSVENFEISICLTMNQGRLSFAVNDKDFSAPFLGTLGFNGKFRLAVSLTEKGQSATLVDPSIAMNLPELLCENFPQPQPQDENENNNNNNVDNRNLENSENNSDNNNDNNNNNTNSLLPPLLTLHELDPSYISVSNNNFSITSHQDQRSSVFSREIFDLSTANISQKIVFPRNNTDADDDEIEEGDVAVGFCKDRPGPFVLRHLVGEVEILGSIGVLVRKERICVIALDKLVGSISRDQDQENNNQNNNNKDVEIIIQLRQGKVSAVVNNRPISFSEAVENFVLKGFGRLMISLTKKGQKAFLCHSGVTFEETETSVLERIEATSQSNFHHHNNTTAASAAAASSSSSSSPIIESMLDNRYYSENNNNNNNDQFVDNKTLLMSRSNNNNNENNENNNNDDSHIDNRNVG